ncbi:MAG: hypothetical protein ACFFDN_26305 [Candidatus Hodarchaeota archaeon]
MKYRNMTAFVSVTIFILLIGIHSTLIGQMKMDKEQSTLNNQSKPQIDIKERYILIYESLKDIYNDYIIDVVKTVAFLIICLGWLITSDKSRNFVKKNKATRMASIIIIVLLFILNIHTAIKAYNFSQDKISELSLLNYIEPKYYENYAITTDLLVSNIILHTALFALLVVILISLKEAKLKT